MLQPNGTFNPHGHYTYEIGNSQPYTCQSAISRLQKTTIHFW